MQVEQYVMAYEVEQDRLRALLPAGFVSLRPVLRINGEIRRGPEETAYLEHPHHAMVRSIQALSLIHI